MELSALNAQLSAADTLQPLQPNQQTGGPFHAIRCRERERSKITDVFAMTFCGTGAYGCGRQEGTLEDFNVL